MDVPALNEPFVEGTFRRLLASVRNLAVGGTNAAGVFTLMPGATETVVPARECGEASLPLIVPWSEAAANSGWYIKGVERGRFEVGHDPAPQGATFRYELRQP